MWFSLLLIPEVRRSNPVISKTLLLSDENDENKENTCLEWPLKKACMGQKLIVSYKCFCGISTYKFGGYKFRWKSSAKFHTKHAFTENCTYRR